MDDDRDDAPDVGGGEERGSHQSASGSSIDIAVLAQKVYRLMREELRLERERGAHVFERGGA